MTEQKIDWDKPLQLIDTCWHDWHDSRKTSCMFDDNGMPIGFWVHSYDGCRSALFDLNGNILAGHKSIKIRNKPAKKKICGWMNVYPDGYSSSWHVTREKADEYAGPKYVNLNRVACVYIEKEYEEGEGLE